MDANLGNVPTERIHDQLRHLLMKGKGLAWRGGPQHVENMIHFSIKPCQEISLSGQMKHVLMVVASQVCA
ncbi:MAG: hypothetical protein EA399_08495 [Desulfovibrionales bacterium]|nr:MAG: hypothetical protein EA399_08495 [Desulfovibrionales bacterium]